MKRKLSVHKLDELIETVRTGKPPTQDRGENFRSKGKLFLVRCYICDPKYGKENYAVMVASGQCAWCGWKE